MTPGADSKTLFIDSLRHSHARTHTSTRKKKGDIGAERRRTKPEGLSGESILGRVDFKAMTRGSVHADRPLSPPLPSSLSECCKAEGKKVTCRNHGGEKKTVFLQHTRSQAPCPFSAQPLHPRWSSSVTAIIQQCLLQHSCSSGEKGI